MTEGLNRASPWTPGVALQRRLRLLSTLPNTVQNQLLTPWAQTFLGKGPSATVGLVLDDGLFYSQGFTSPNLAQASLSDPTADTVYRIASQNKAVTALGFRRLLEMYPSVSATDPVSKYVPDAKYIVGPDGKTPTKAITLLDLVTHVSGLPNIADPYYPPQTVIASPTEAQFLTMLHSVHLDNEPEVVREYSGVGMSLLGIAMEKISGVSYRTFMQNNVLSKLKMGHTAFDASLLPAGSTIAKRYAPASPTYALDTSPYVDLVALSPAGQLFSTVRDMTSLIQYELSSAAASSTFNSSTLFSKQADLVQTQTPHFSTLHELCGYGWWLEGGVSRSYVHHNGGRDDFESNLFFSPASRIGVDVLISTQDSTNTDLSVPTVLDQEIAADANNDWHNYPLSMALERVMFIINNGYSSATPGNFVSPPAGLSALVASWSASGKCNSFTVNRLYSMTQGDFTLQCTAGTIPVSLTAAGGAPYLIDSLNVGCGASGQDCSTAGACCSGLVCNMSNQEFICTPPGCSARGLPCQTNGACCSNSCDPNAGFCN